MDQENFLIIGMLPGERQEDIEKLGKGNIYYMDCNIDNVTDSNNYLINFNNYREIESKVKQKFDKIYFDFSTIKFLYGENMIGFFRQIYNILNKNGRFYYYIHSNPGGIISFKPDNRKEGNKNGYTFYEVGYFGLYYMCYCDGDPYKGCIKPDITVEYYKFEIIDKVIKNNIEFWKKLKCNCEYFYETKDYPLYNPSSKHHIKEYSGYFCVEKL